MPMLCSWLMSTMGNMCTNAVFAALLELAGLRQESIGNQYQLAALLFMHLAFAC